MIFVRIILFLCILASYGRADALYWLVDEHAEVIGSSGQNIGDLNTFLVPVQWTDEDHRPKTQLPDGTFIYGDGVGDAIVAARINVYDGNGNFLKTLENIHGDIVDDSWHSPVDIGHPNAPNGVGATAKSSNMNNNKNNLAEYYQIAIMSRVQGEWNAGVFQEIAWSALYSGELLEHNGNYVLSDDEAVVAALRAFAPSTYYTTRPVPMYDYHPAPEPNSGMLVLIGMSVLLLKRKS